MKSCLYSLAFLFILVGIPFICVRLLDLDTTLGFFIYLISFFIFIVFYASFDSGKNKKNDKNNVEINEPRKIKGWVHPAIPIYESAQEYKKRVALKKLEKILDETTIFADDLEKLGKNKIL